MRTLERAYTDACMRARARLHAYARAPDKRAEKFDKSRYVLHLESSKYLKNAAFTITNFYQSKKFLLDKAVNLFLPFNLLNGK